MNRKSHEWGVIDQSWRNKNNNGYKYIGNKTVTMKYDGAYTTPCWRIAPHNNIEGAIEGSIPSGRPMYLYLSQLKKMQK